MIRQPGADHTVALLVKGKGQVAHLVGRPGQPMEENDRAREIPIEDNVVIRGGDGPRRPVQIKRENESHFEPALRIGVPCPESR